MLLTIHNLPVDIHYREIKTLLLSKCGIHNVILDNLSSEGNGKKVTVGVAQEEDAAILVRKINGLYLNGQQLYVEDVRQTKPALEQPFRSSNPQMQESMQQGYNNMAQKGIGSGLGNMVTPSVQPMTSMYYVPADYTQQTQGYGTAGWGLGMTAQGFTPMNQVNALAPEMVPNPYMDAGRFDQSAQASQYGSFNQFTNNQKSHQVGSLGNANHNYEEDTAKSTYRRFDKPAGWNAKDARHREASPPRDRSNVQWQPRDSGNRGPRPERPPRPDERTFGNVRPEFEGTATRRSEFSGRSEFHEPPRSNERSGFRRSDRSDFERPPERAEFGRPNYRPDSEGPNNRPEYGSRRESERPYNRPDNGRPNNRADLGRPNIRPEIGRSTYRPESMRHSKPENRHSEAQFHHNKSEFRHSKPAFQERSDRGGRSDRGDARPLPMPRKRRFDEVPPTESNVDRPERLSRPDNVRQHLSPSQTKMPRGEPNSELTNRPEQNIKTSKQQRDLKYSVARNIMFDMIASLGLQNPDLITKQEVRKFVSARLDTLPGDTFIHNAPQAILVSYRKIYPRESDKDDYLKILESIAERKANEPEAAVNPATVNQPVNPAVVQPPVNPAVVQPPVNPPAIKSPVQPAVSKMPAFKPAVNPTTLNPAEFKTPGKPGVKNPKKRKLIPLAPGQKIPSFPGGDKSILAKQKKDEKECYVPEVPDIFEKPIEEELGAITKLLIEELDHGSYDVKKVYNTVNRSELTEDIKKVLHQQLARRITNSGLKVIRVMGAPRLPRRAEVEGFLMHYGTISLRKSEKAPLYTAAVKTYDSYDLLCSMDPVPVGIEGNMLSFKPFHLTVKPRADQQWLKKERLKLIQTMVDRSNVNLLAPDWPTQEAVYKEKEAAEAIIKEKQLADAKERAIAAARDKEQDSDVAEDKNDPNDGVVDASDLSPEIASDADETHNEVHETGSDIECEDQSANELDDDENELDWNDDSEDQNKDESNEIDDNLALSIEDVDMEIDDDDLEDY